MSKKILVIDDEEMVLHTIKVIFEDMGYEITTHQDPLVGMNEAINNNFDLIILDLRMPKKNGAEITEEILNTKPNARILILTAHPTDPFAKKALEAGALSLVRKPFEIGKILNFLK
ncbi:MAG: response regulator [Promethearchaeota archaeon]